MKRFLSIFLAIFALTLAACTSSEEENGNNSQGGGDKPSSQPEVTITTPPAPTVSGKGGNDIIAFHAEKPWSAKVLNTRAEGWCSIYPTSGQAGDVEITITTAPNDTDDDRSATIIIQAGSTQIVITITQKQQDALTVTASKFEVEAEGGEVEIEVKANVDYDYTIDPDAADWVKYKATRALESSTLVFEVAENEDMEKREAQIMIHSGDLEELVTIYQEGNEPTIILSKNEYTVSDKGETIAVEVKSNVDVAVEIPSDVDWVKENSTRAMSTNTFYLDVAPNEDYKSRSAAVKFTNKENGLSEIVMISQAQMDAIVIAKDSYTIDNEGGEIDIEVGHNVDFDVEISDSWITKTSTRAFETETLTFTIAANNSDDGREGTIKFISKDKAISQTVKVYQSQSNALIVSKKDIVIDEKEQTVEFEVRANVEYTVSSSSASWLHREDTRAMTSQTIRYRVDANSDYNSRTATITVQSKDGSLKETITITQAQKDAIVLAKNSYTIDNEGGEIDIEVGHNVDFDVEISDNWITKATTRVFETETLTFNIAANNSNDSREGTIKFISKDKSISQTVKVYQSQSNALIVSKKDIVIDEKEQTVEFEVRANVEYTVSSSSASWLHREDTRAMTSQTIRYRVDANSDYNSRTATITVQSKDGSLKETITITQAQKDAIVLAKNSYAVDNEGGKIDIEVGHNVDFDVEISDSWITKTSTRAFDTETLTFTIAANNSDDSREGTIKFISKDKSITQTVKIEQESNYDPTKPRNNEIWYTTTDGMLLDPYNPKAFGANIVSNIYENGKGVITFDGSVTEIGNDAFRSSKPLTSIILPNSVTMIGNNAFVYCRNLTSINIPDNVTCIGYDALCSCESLKNITIPNSVTDIDNRAFYLCGKLKNITIPDSVTKIGDAAFAGCRSLKAFYGKFATDDNLALVVNGVLNAFAIGSGTTAYIIPDNVTEIGSQAFWFCSSLTSVTIPNSVTKIGDATLDDCDNLKVFYGKFASADNRCLIVDGVLKAFAPADLTSYSIPNNVTEIGDSAFSNASLTDVTIPESVTKIGDYGFFSNCIASVYCKPHTPPQIGYNTFRQHTIICVSNESYNQYIANQQWSKYNIVSESVLSNSTDKAALVALYNSTNGDNWTNNTNWCSDRPLNEWYGISLDEQGYVKKINLHNNNLTGCIPAELGNLTKLHELNLGSNQLTGCIPAELGFLSMATLISLYNNGLSGSVPESIMKAHYWIYNWHNIIDQNYKKGGGISREGLVIPAPKFEVTTIDGANISDDIYSKNKLTIMYHFYDWCPYSTIFTPKLKNIYNEYKNRGVDVLCFNSETNDIAAMNRIIKAYRDKFELPWHCFAGWSLTPAYIGSPQVDVVNQDGYIVFNRALDSYNDLGDFLKEYFNDDYSSTDYSQDGKVTKLQSATKGNGIDIVLMGDAFTDRLIADGTYEKTMRTAMEKFFTEEPYKSYRDHFNVYSVTAVSKNDIYGEGYETAFSGFFGEGTHVGGDNAKVLQYAQKAISDDRIDKSLMIVMMNSTSNAGTCYMYYTSTGDYGNGASISYFPIGADETALEQVLRHEACGHGFAKLGDEYAYEEYGTIPAAEVQSHAQLEPYGWWKNVDFTSDPTKVKWAHFLSDTRYANDGLGVFEGGLTYWRGVWRPTENSIMRHNTGGFNAPSREAIYYRIHKLAYGDSWEYDYEEFVEWDAKNRKTAATRGVPYRIETPKNFKPLAPPVVIEKSWRDAK